MRKVNNTDKYPTHSEPGRPLVVALSSPYVHAYGSWSPCGTSRLVLALVLGLGDSDDHVGDVIPRVMDADEHQQHRCPGNEEEGRYRIG